MKKITLILWMFLISALLLISIKSFAHQRRIHIRHHIHADCPSIRSEPVMCIADKDAGSVELNFRINVGEVKITLIDSNGNSVDERVLDTGVENFANLDIPDSQESYVLKIEGDYFIGEGSID